MKEIEVKILAVNREELEVKLLEMGARKIPAKTYTATHFDKEKQLKKAHKKLRLRQEGDKAVLCFKEPISFDDVKIMEESEVIVDNLEMMHEILIELGYKAKRKTTKTRVSYVLEDIQFDFDKYHGKYEHIPEFLELEAQNKETIYTYAALLGFSKKQLKTWTTGELIKFYKSP